MGGEEEVSSGHNEVPSVINFIQIEFEYEFASLALIFVGETREARNPLAPQCLAIVKSCMKIVISFLCWCLKKLKLSA